MWYGSKASRLFSASVLRRDFRALAFAYLGCALASTVAVFQFAVFTSFLQAAYVPVSFIGGDLWITGRGVRAFDFSYPIATDLFWRTAKCYPEAAVQRVASGFTSYQSPTGNRGAVMVVGYDKAPVEERNFLVDGDDLIRLNLNVGSDAEIGRLSMTHSGTTNALKTFLGAPYAIVSWRSAVSALNLPTNSASFLVIELRHASQRDIIEAQRCAMRILGTHADVMSREQFSRSSAIYWLMKTGAGAAILIAASLAAVLNLVILVNGISRIAQRHSASLLSILGHGGNVSDIRAILIQLSTLLIGLTLLTTLVALPVFDAATNWLVPWVTVKGVDIAFAIVLMAVGLLAGALAANGQVKRFEVSALFRL